MVTSASSGNHENDGFSVFPTKIPKMTNPKSSRIFLRSFCATVLIIFTIKMHPRPPRPQIRIFPDFPDSHGKSMLQRGNYKMHDPHTTAIYWNLRKYCFDTLDHFLSKNKYCFDGGRFSENGVWNMRTNVENQEKVYFSIYLRKRRVWTNWCFIVANVIFQPLFKGTTRLRDVRWK